MIPAFLITFREVIEASLIVATILGVLTKLNRKGDIKTVWHATGLAASVSVALLGIGSVFGLKMQEYYTGRTESIIEGSLMIISALFITYAVFFLHKYFSRYKIHLLKKIRETMEKGERNSLFILVFTAVFREGFEIVLFLTTIYLSSDPRSIFSGFIFGAVGGLAVSFALFAATLKLPVYYAFRTTSILLILFAAGLLTRGIHEFAEAGLLPEIGRITINFMPQKATIAADLLKAVFGITQSMDIVQLLTYSAYVGFMSWWVFFRNRTDFIENK